MPELCCANLGVGPRIPFSLECEIKNVSALYILQEGKRVRHVDEPTAALSWTTPDREWSAPFGCQRTAESTESSYGRGRSRSRWIVGQAPCKAEGGGGDGLEATLCSDA